MEQIVFSIIGGGWRTQMFMRIARECPEMFRVASVMVRDLAKRDEFARNWNVKVCSNLDDLLLDKPNFVVISSSTDSHPVFIEELCKLGYPVLSETPPASNIEDLEALYNKVGKTGKIQIAEQYHLQPMHAARMSLINSGLIGDVSQAQVSAAHGYHGISLIRKLLNIKYDCVKIRAIKFESNIIKGPQRAKLPLTEEIDVQKQHLAWFDFGDKLGVFDFAGTQYHNWVRSNRIYIQGTKGEIKNSIVTYLKDFQTPITLPLTRYEPNRGVNLESHSLKSITFGDNWIYNNPLFPARLSDDEIAMASCLKGMSEYINGSSGFYSLAEACHDQYLAILMQKAAESKEEIVSEMKTWTNP